MTLLIIGGQISTGGRSSRCSSSRASRLLEQLDRVAHHQVRDDVVQLARLGKDRVQRRHDESIKDLQCVHRRLIGVAPLERIEPIGDHAAKPVGSQQPILRRERDGRDVALAADPRTKTASVPRRRTARRDRRRTARPAGDRRATRPACGAWPGPRGVRSTSSVSDAPSKIRRWPSPVARAIRPPTKSMTAPFSVSISASCLTV